MGQFPNSRNNGNTSGHIDEIICTVNRRAGLTCTGQMTYCRLTALSSSTETMDDQYITVTILWICNISYTITDFTCELSLRP